MSDIPLWRCERCGIETHQPGSMPCERNRLRNAERVTRSRLPFVLRHLPFPVLLRLAGVLAVLRRLVA